MKRDADRIRRVAAENPDMPLSLLAERFGTSVAAIRGLLADAGIHRKPDYFSAAHNGVRNKRARR